MKLFYSPTSPYVRKVSIVAQLTGLEDRIQRIPSAPHPIDRDRTILPSNPLGKAPTLVLDDGTALFDSRVIIEYLDANSMRDRVLPASGPERWRVLTRQALGDGILDAALLIRYENSIRTPEHRLEGWITGQFAKIDGGLAQFEADPPTKTLDAGTIALGAALGFLDFRLPDHAWRGAHPQLTAWYDWFDSLPIAASTRPAVPQIAAQ
jgi:glutathione S-transferase